jgi:tRNA A37 threonylcarbamoyltransferase TsaD
MKKDGILSRVVASQDDVHKNERRCVPNLASRHHLKTSPRSFSAALEQAKTPLSDLDSSR